MSYEQAPHGRIVGHVGESVMVYFETCFFLWSRSFVNTLFWYFVAHFVSYSPLLMFCVVHQCRWLYVC